MADFTIEVTEVGGVLYYNGSGLGGKTKGPKRHNVFPGNDAFWASREGDVSIRFKNSTRIVFESPNDIPIEEIGVFAAQSAASGPLTTTPPLRVDSEATRRRRTKYSVHLLKGGVPFIEDPDFEDGPDGGGGKPTASSGKRPSKSKAAKPRKKKAVKKALRK